MGNPVEVTALVGNLAHDTEVEDIACAAIRFESGAYCSLQCDLISQPEMASRVISGDKGILTLEEKITGKRRWPRVKPE